MATKETIKDKDFEQELKKLEKIVTKMESGKLNLEDTLKEYEDGIKLAGQCQSLLKAAEQKVKILTEKTEKMSLTDFSPEKDSND